VDSFASLLTPVQRGNPEKAHHVPLLPIYLLTKSPRFVSSTTKNAKISSIMISGSVRSSKMPKIDPTGRLISTENEKR